MQRRHRLGIPYQAALVLSILPVILLLSACGDNSANKPPSAQQLISKAQTAINKVKSYHFNLAVDNPGNNGAFTIKSADGDILVPDKLKSNATTLILGTSVQVQFISVADKQYVTDPITGKWSPTSGLLDPRSLSDPQTGVAAILGHMQNLSTPTDSNVDGTACWSIDGKLDAQYLTSITGGGLAPGTLVNVNTCIGKADNLPYLIKMNGKAAQGDLSNTSRTFKLSKFGETLTITAPI